MFAPKIVEGAKPTWVAQRSLAQHEPLLQDEGPSHLDIDKEYLEREEDNKYIEQVIMEKDNEIIYLKASGLSKV